MTHPVWTKEQEKIICDLRESHVQQLTGGRKLEDSAAGGIAPLTHPGHQINPDHIDFDKLERLINRFYEDQFFNGEFMYKSTSHDHRTPKLVMMNGASGVGKTEFLNDLFKDGTINRNDVYLRSRDDVTRPWLMEYYKTNGKLIADIIKPEYSAEYTTLDIQNKFRENLLNLLENEMTYRAVAAGIHIVWDGQLRQDSTLESVKTITQGAGYDSTVIVVTADPETWKKRKEWRGNDFDKDDKKGNYEFATNVIAKNAEKVGFDAVMAQVELKNTSTNVVVINTNQDHDPQIVVEFNLGRLAALKKDNFDAWTAQLEKNDKISPQEISKLRFFVATKTKENPKIKLLDDLTKTAEKISLAAGLKSTLKLLLNLHKKQK